MPATDAATLPGVYRALHDTGLIGRLLDLAFDEDLAGAGDVTSLASIPPDGRAEATLVARTSGVVAGLEALPDVLAAFARRTGPSRVRVRAAARDADDVPAGSTLATLEGPLRDLLAIERTLLNLVGRLSGIATLTRQYARRIEGAGRATLYDTRKTTPGLRVLEKYAVRCGGGRSHRLGLHDAMLLKDNHLAGVSLAALPSFVAAAVARARAASPIAFAQVEVDSLDQLDALLSLPPGTIDIVLLDNMRPPDLREASRRRDARRPELELEASGGITLDTIGEVASTGVDRISVGALTHQARSLDVALDVTA